MPLVTDLNVCKPTHDPEGGHPDRRREPDGDLHAGACGESDAGAIRRISSTRVAIRKGFSRYAAAPRRRASDPILAPPNAVMIMTGKLGQRRMRVLRTSSPFPPGRLMSSMTTSGR